MAIAHFHLRVVNKLFPLVRALKVRRVEGASICSSNIMCGSRLILRVHFPGDGRYGIRRFLLRQLVSFLNQGELMDTRYLEELSLVLDHSRSAVLRDLLLSHPR